jgi:cytidylate kinase
MTNPLAPSQTTPWATSLQTGAPGRKIVIAVDGPAAAGKGTLAVNLARRMGLGYLDTGALYRAVGMAVLETGGDPADINDVAPALDIVRRNLTPELLASPDLRAPAVATAASKSSALPEVRAALLDFQRDFAVNPRWAFAADGTLTTALDTIGGCVLDGRDIGTVVCPDADIKFFVTAAPEVRAQRRLAELQLTGQTGFSFDQVLADLVARDQRDASRATAPTRAADDAHLLDTSNLNAEQTLEEALAVVRARFLAETAG